MARDFSEGEIMTTIAFPEGTKDTIDEIWTTKALQGFDKKNINYIEFEELKTLHDYK